MPIPSAFGRRHASSVRGVPYEEQQFHAVMAENGVLEIPDVEMADLARQIGRAYAVVE